MAQRSDKQIARTVRRLKYSAGKYRRRAAIYEEYSVAHTDELEKRRVVKDGREAELFARKLRKAELGFADTSADFEAFLEKAEKERRAKLRMKYRARRESLRRKAKKDTSINVDEILALYQEELDNKLSCYLESLKADYAKFNSAERNVDELKQKYERLKAELEEKSVKNVETRKKKCAAASERTKNTCAKRSEKLRAKADLCVKKIEELLSGHVEELGDNKILEVKDLCMYFGGLHAVETLSFDVKEGEIFGLIGPNGAGKTTVFNCITQFYKPTSGDILFRNKVGEVIHMNDYAVHDVILEGIVRTFQNVEVVREISVLDNLLVAATRQYTANLFEQMFHLPILKQEEIVYRRRAEKVLAFLGLTPYRDMYAMGLPYGVLKKIEIARTLMTDPQLIILDEPAAGLNDTETAELAELIRRIRKEYDCTILLVEHDMGLVMNICDRICAISFGKLLGTGTPKEIQSNKAVQEAYLGVGGGE